MEFFKAFLVKKTKVDKIASKLSKYCSQTPHTIMFDQTKYLAVKYNPDVYFSNLDKIAKLFSKGKISPLMMTNFKFLQLLKKCSYYDLKFNNLELSGGNDEEFYELVYDGSEDLGSLKDFLDTYDQKIKYFEFKYKDNRNFIRIYQTGVISVTEGFANIQERDSLLEKVIVFLFEGNEV